MVDIFDPELEDVDIKINDNKLVKGDEVNLLEKDPTMQRVLIGLGWDLNAFDSDPLDLDVSCFLLDKHEKTRVNEDFVFYNNLEGCNGAIVHNGDNRTGAGDGDDESISLDLTGIPFDVIRVAFVLSIYQGEEKEQRLAKVRNAYVRLVNRDNAQEILRYEISPDLEDRAETAMIVAYLNREGPKWHFVAAGECVKGGLAKVATNYDIIVKSV